MEKIYTDCKRPIMGKARLPKMRKRDVASLKDASRERSIMLVEIGALFYPGEIVNMPARICQLGCPPEIQMLQHTRSQFKEVIKNILCQIRNAKLV